VRKIFRPYNFPLLITRRFKFSLFFFALRGWGVSPTARSGKGPIRRRRKNTKKIMNHGHAFRQPDDEKDTSNSKITVTS
jgi:hypothetical protein